jgi:hypothetical protein
VAAGYSPKVQLEIERQHAEHFRARVAARRAGRKISPPPPLPAREKPVIDGQTWIIIGDSHAHPDHPNHRFEWLGRMLVDLQPTGALDMGDWWDMPSLSSYDVGTRSFESRRYFKDIEAGIDAMERVQLQLDEYNRGRRKKYKPRLVRTLGNHENRISKITELEPRMHGIIGTDDLMSAEFGWEEYSFLDPVVIQGVAFSHYFTSGTMGRPIGGEHPATMLLKKQFHSAIQGHSHVLDYADRTDATGRPIQAMHSGCYFDFDFDWAGKQPNQMYRRGLLVLRNMRDGQFDPEWISIDRVESQYG